MIFRIKSRILGKIPTIIFIGLATMFLFSSCASGYKMVRPNTLNYVSTDQENGIRLEYKYDLLIKKYAKKELKKGVKLVAVKITNNSENDVRFGSDVKLTYQNGQEIYIMDNADVFKTLKQSPASYLWYLLLTPVNFYTTEYNSSSGFEETTSSTPIGLILGPGLAAGNMVAAGSANKKFKMELMDYNLAGTIIKKGETKFGLLGFRTDSFEALGITVNQ